MKTKTNKLHLNNKSSKKSRHQKTIKTVAVLRYKPIVLACVTALSFGSLASVNIAAACTPSITVFCGVAGGDGGNNTESAAGAGGVGSNPTGTYANNGGDGSDFGTPLTSADDGQGFNGMGGAGAKIGPNGEFLSGAKGGKGGINVAQGSGGGGGGSHGITSPNGLYFGHGSGGGGGGGAGRLISTDVSINGQSIYGGAGGNGGGDKSDFDESARWLAGAGGGGGAGVYASGGIIDIDNNSLIQGGAGGASLGSDGNIIFMKFDSNAGGGGAGIGAKDNAGIKINNSGKIIGGAGGSVYGFSMSDIGYMGSGGIGGFGIIGSGLEITNDNEIKGGAGGHGGSGGNMYGKSIGGHGGVGGDAIAGNNNTITNSGKLYGGAGGDGGKGYSPNGNYGISSNGDGGNAGAGVNGEGFNLTNTGYIKGGKGGKGHDTLGYNYYTNAGHGGDGGAGVTGKNFIVDNGGNIVGGAGGPKGEDARPLPGWTPSEHGKGAVGLLSEGGSNITTSGHIAGSQEISDDSQVPGAQNNAVDLSGGGNILTLEKGYSFLGNIVSHSGDIANTNVKTGVSQDGDTLGLGGDDDADFDLSQIVNNDPLSYSRDPVYAGFNQFEKTGESTWLVTNTTESDRPWTVKQGTLMVGDTTSPDALIPGSVGVDSAGVLRGVGTIGGDVTNSGIVWPGDTDSMGLLTIKGDYTGNDGVLQVRTNWDDPDVQTSDQLLIEGKAFGTTVVKAVHGSGGSSEGITGNVSAPVGDATKNGGWQTPIVMVYGGDDGNNFTGTAPTAGAGEAQLFNRQNDDNAQGGSAYYWTLYAVDPDNPVNPANPSDPASKPKPIYIPGTSGYVQMSRVNRDMGFSQLSRLHERVGEQQTWSWDHCGTNCDEYNRLVQADNRPIPLWGRIEAGNLKEQGKDRFGYSSNQYLLQFGGDLRVKVDADRNHQHIGLFTSFSRGEHKFYDKYRTENALITDKKLTGRGYTDMLSLGAYSTWYRTNGTYIDLVGNVSYIHNKYKSQSGNASQNGYGLAASVEIGRPWRLGDSNWQIEPQAQLAYQYVNLSGFKDESRHISGQSKGGLRGRLGVRLAWNADNGHQRTNTFYVTANVLHDFTGNKSAAKIGTDRVRESYNRTWGEISVGTQFALSKSMYLFGDIRYDRSFSNSTKVYRGSGVAKEGYSGRIGIRYTW